MVLPATFSNNTNPTGPQLDACLAEIAYTGITPCTATGTNSITLTPLPNTATVSVYANYQLFGFVAAATTTSGVTLRVGTLSSLPVYAAGTTATQASTNSFINGVYYVVAYNLALNGGAGGFVIINAGTTSITNPLPITEGGTGLQNAYFYDTGSVNAIAITTGLSFATPPVGVPFNVFVANVTTSTTVTLAVDGGTAYAVELLNGVAPPIGAIFEGLYTFIFTGGTFITTGVYYREATSTEIGVGAETNVVVTPGNLPDAFTAYLPGYLPPNFPSVFASSGSVELPGGFTLNWGSDSIPPNTSSPVTFNNAFSTAAFAAFVTPVDSGTTANYRGSVFNLGLTGMDIINAAGASLMYYYMAIGH